MTNRDVTGLLGDLSGGRPEAMEELMPIIYDELRMMAHRHLRNERDGHTLSTTALVHESYFKLINVERVKWQDRAHFFAMASRSMRRILIDYARTRGREKRGGNLKRVSIQMAFHVAEDSTEDLLALDDALTRLEAVNEAGSDRGVSLLRWTLRERNRRGPGHLPRIRQARLGRDPGVAK